LEELNRRLTVVVEPKQHELANQIGALRLEHDTVRDVTNQLNQRMERTLQKAELDAALSKIQRIEQQLLSTTFALRNTPERPLLEARNGLRS
jgi:hemerythrin-like domain-containing protein